MNYFKQQVFSDTTYNVIAFYYRKKVNQFSDKFSIKTHIYPDNKFINIELNKKFNWAIGGNFLTTINKQKNELGVHRLTEKNILIEKGEKEVMVAFNHVKNIATIRIDKETYKVIKNNLILLKAIDTGTEKGKIALENIKNYNVECLISKESSRNMIYLLFEKEISLSEQEKIIELFNQEINKLREKYLSLFLTNFRDNDRKRVSFDFAYKFINYLYYNRIANYAEKQSVLL
jgi:predicted Fe-Mo cluster-binding NifX family protein